MLEIEQEARQRLTELKEEARKLEETRQELERLRMEDEEQRRSDVLLRAEARERLREKQEESRRRMEQVTQEAQTNAWQQQKLQREKETARKRQEEELLREKQIEEEAGRPKWMAELIKKKQSKSNQGEQKEEQQQLQQQQQVEADQWPYSPSSPLRGEPCKTYKSITSRDYVLRCSPRQWRRGRIRPQHAIQQEEEAQQNVLEIDQEARQRLIKLEEEARKLEETRQELERQRMEDEEQRRSAELLEEEARRRLREKRAKSQQRMVQLTEEARKLEETRQELERQRIEDEEQRRSAELLEEEARQRLREKQAESQQREVQLTEEAQKNALLQKQILQLEKEFARKRQEEELRTFRNQEHAYESDCYTENQLHQQHAPVAAVRKALQRKKDRTRKQAKSEIGLNSHKLNYGFAGPINSGKSSLVNALRGFSAKEINDKNFAAVNFLEATSKVAKYKFKDKRLKNLVFWDIPGSGSLQHSNLEDYFRKNYLYIFDCLFLLLGEGNLTENDVMFARQAKDAETPLAFIRSKSDTLVERMSKDPMTPKFGTVEETSTYIYNKVTENHRKLCPPDLQDVPYFLVSSDTILMIFHATTIPEKDSWRAGFDEVNLMEFIGSCARPRHPELKENVFSMLGSEVLSFFSRP
uniref:IRG-type G domain-containing protein n=1 Tax=Plectus sambesii TaxID=2011161 RepID=A0A914V8H3_9BILA